MRKLIFLLALFCVFQFGHKTKEVECNTSAFWSYTTKDSLPLYDSPGGKIIRFLKNDPANDDFVGAFKILSKRGNALRIASFLSAKRLGWIYLNDSICVFSRAYQGGLKLYEKPTEESEVSCVIEEYDPGMYSVIDCYQDWLKVKRILHGKVYEGWMPPEMQCPEIMTTCS